MPQRADVVDFGGAGIPIVLSHGLMGSARTWWSVAKWLRTYGHVVGMDARGHGGSDEGPWHTESSVADIVELITELDSGPAVVIGHSMGGLHAWVLAAEHPELVRAVVVEDMVPDRRGDTAEPRRDYWTYVDNVLCPLLVLEAEHTAMPAGQQAELARRVPGGGRHLRILGSSHIVHDSRPAEYRGAVEAFLCEVLGR